METKRRRKLTQERADSINRKRDLKEGHERSYEHTHERVGPGRGQEAVEPTLECLGPQPVSLEYKGISLDSMLFPWDGLQPVFLRMPGSEFWYLPCFSSQAQLEDFMRAGGIAYRSIKHIDDGPEFLSSFDGHRHELKVIIDPFFLPNGRLRFTEVRWPTSSMN